MDVYMFNIQIDDINQYLGLLHKLILISYVLFFKTDLYLNLN